jgi:alpha-N-arabinofuranosidase
VLLPISLDAGRYEHGTRAMPAVSASASRAHDGLVHVTMTNLDPNRARTVEIVVRGRRVASVSGRILTAERMDAHNTFEQPAAVAPAPFTGARLAGETITVTLPAKSLVVLELR